MQETKACADPTCQHGGQPQPIAVFGYHPPSKKPFSICRDCRVRRMAEGRKAKKAAKKQPAPITTKEATHKPTSGTGLLINKPPESWTEDALKVIFQARPEVLEQVKKMARQEMRTAADQVVYVMSVFSDEYHRSMEVLCQKKPQQYPK